MTNHLSNEESERLAILEAVFDECGGRGVELAEEIDALRAKRDGTVRHGVEIPVTTTGVY